MKRAEDNREANSSCFFIIFERSDSRENEKRDGDGRKDEEHGHDGC